ncbi:MAG: ABC transporter permease [Chloroflexi bacterium]|nr:ABC transporter permease [Chloroflexota bacterium]
MTETAISDLSANQKNEPFLGRFRNIGVLAVLVILLMIAAIFTPKHTFISGLNIRTMLSFGAEFGIVALGVGVLMIAGEFDLSVGSIIAMCALVFASVVEAGINPFVAVVLALLCGALIGIINGVIVVRFRIVSFIVTLGMMMSLRGLAEILSRGRMFSVQMADYPLFLELVSGQLFGVIPMQFVWFLLIAVVLGFVLDHGRFGNWIYSTGDNVQAARAMGIRSGQVKIICFVIVGVLTAFAAVLQTTRLTAYSVHMGTGWELQAVAAVVVGGTSLMGGRGNMTGIVLGTLVIIVVDNMISQLRLPYEYTFIVFGVVIMGSALMDMWIERQAKRSGG